MAFCFFSLNGKTKWNLCKAMSIFNKRLYKYSPPSSLHIIDVTLSATAALRLILICPNQAGTSGQGNFSPFFLFSQTQLELLSGCWRAWTALFMSSHKFSVGLRSGHWSCCPNHMMFFSPSAKCFVFPSLYMKIVHKDWLTDLYSDFIWTLPYVLGRIYMSFFHLHLWLVETNSCLSHLSHKTYVIYT